MKSGSDYFYQSGPASSSGTSILAVVSKTTTYTADTADDLILASTAGGTWTLTLYTAVGNNGRVLRVQKTTSDVTKLTIDGNGSETINGSTTTTLCTQYEEIALVSDGSNWLILERRIPSTWVAYTPTVTNFPTISNVEVLSKREGSDLLIAAKYTLAAGGTAAEGRLTMGFGGTNNNVTSAGTGSIPSIRLAGGPMALSVNSASQFLVLIEPSVNYLTFGIQGAANSGLTKTNGDTIAGGTVSWLARVPIVDWAG